MLSSFEPSYGVYIVGLTYWKDYNLVLDYITVLETPVELDY